MYVILADFEPLNHRQKEKDFQLLPLHSFIDIIHSTENKAIREGMTSVNSNNKSSHVASTFAAICRDDFRRVCMES